MKEFPYKEAAAFIQNYACSMLIPVEWRCFADSIPDDAYLDTLLSLTDPNSYYGDYGANSIQEFAKTCHKYSYVGKYSWKDYDNGTKRRKNIKLKKTYEIEEILSRIRSLLQEYDIDRAVDVGAGQGYLTIELANNCPFLQQIVAIECSDLQVHGMQDRIKEGVIDDQSKIVVKKIRVGVDRHENYFDVPGFDPTPPYLMYSLHACGSLSEIMVQKFCDPLDSAKILFNVSCCYNLIDEKLPGLHFPISTHLATIWKTPLTRNMKMVACQAPYRWRHRIQQTRNFFKRHFYRALLEQLIMGQDNIEASLKIGNISDSALGSFSSYAQVAFTNMGIDGPDDETVTKLYEKYMSFEKLLAFMWTIRALLGPPVESLILYDRLLFIREHLKNVEVDLVPILDPLASPRNMALIAIKADILEKRKEA